MNPTRIQLRYDTVSNWETGSTKLLAQGEVGIALKADNTIEARVGTGPNTSWADAKVLTATPGEMGTVNIENVGRVIMELYTGSSPENDLSFSSCIESFTLSTAANGPSPFSEKNCSLNNITVDNVFPHINVLNTSANFVGWRADEAVAYGLVHPQLGNVFKCEEVTSAFSYSNYYPLRPIPRNGSNFVYMENIEIWTLPTGNGQTIEYLGLLDAWVPTPTRQYISNNCIQSCLTEFGICNGQLTCLCENGSCPGFGGCLGGVGGFDQLVSLTDPNFEDYGIISVFETTDNIVIGERIPFIEPKPVKVKGFPVFSPGIVIFDKEKNEYKITDVIEGGTYDSV
jgi:hypothetical protein